jgi:hypothetical protein
LWDLLGECHKQLADVSVEPRGGTQQRLAASLQRLLPGIG